MNRIVRTSAVFAALIVAPFCTVAAAQGENTDWSKVEIKVTKVSGTFICSKARVATSPPPSAKTASS